MYNYTYGWIIYNYVRLFSFIVFDKGFFEFEYIGWGIWGFWIWMLLDFDGNILWELAGWIAVKLDLFLTDGLFYLGLFKFFGKIFYFSHLFLIGLTFGDCYYF